MILRKKSERMKCITPAKTIRTAKIHREIVLIVVMQFSSLWLAPFWYIKRIAYRKVHTALCTLRIIAWRAPRYAIPWLDPFPTQKIGTLIGIAGVVRYITDRILSESLALVPTAASLRHASAISTPLCDQRDSQIRQDSLLAQLWTYTIS